MARKKIPFGQLGKAGYNRGIDRAHVNEIKRDFHDDMVQPVIVSFRDGKYWVVDHQHLSTAIYEMNGNNPNTLIDCEVKSGLTYEEEADWYYRLNTGSKPLGFAAKLKGRIESKDATALDFQSVIESCGYIVGGNSNKSFTSIQTAWKLFCKEDGKDMLARILTLTHACWPENKAGVHTDIINGFKVFLENHGDEYQSEHFIKALSANDPKDIVKKSTTFYKQMDSKSFTKPYCTYTQIVNCYNYGLRNKLVAVAPGS